MILYDARGNPINVGFPDAVSNETVSDARPISAVLASVNAEVFIDVNGVNTIAVDARTAAGNLTIGFEATVDGINYATLPAFCYLQVLVATIIEERYVSAVVITSTGAGLYTLMVAGFRRVRVRVTAWTSGNVTVAMRATAGRVIAYARPIPSILHVTATAGANAAATATLPAAGGGLYHYITHIGITRNATAALAGTATIIHTTTNLPGSPAWSVGNAMAAGGTQIDVVYQPTTPLKSLVANTNTTVVAVAGGAAVLGRVNVSYYLGQ
jgi:hypothetical protein